MIDAKARSENFKGIAVCFLAAVLMAVAAYYAGLKIEPGKVLPTGLSMRSGMMSDNIIYGIDLAMDDIDLIKNGNAGADLWRLLTFVHLDLFFYIALLLPKAAAKAVLMTGYFARFGLVAAAMYYFMSAHLKLTRMFSGLLGALYAFSTQIVFTAQLPEIMNMSFMLPVLMSAIDSYYKKRTWKSFSLVCIASFCLGATGGYGIMTGMPAIVFISLLMAFGLYNTSKMALSSWVKALGSIFTGLVMTAAMSVPGLYIMETDVNVSDSFKNAKVLYTVFDVIRGTFMLRSGSIVMNSAPVFYVGILTLVAIIAFALNETIPVRLKVVSAVITSVFYIVCCSSFMNETLSVFGASALISSSRLICLEIVIFFIAGIGLKNIKGLTRGEHIATCLIPLGFLVMANNSTAGTTLASPILIATFIAVIVESSLVYAMAKDKLSNKAKIAVSILLFVFIGVNASFMMFNNTITKTSVEEYFVPDYGAGQTQTLILDEGFDFPAINSGSEYQVVNTDLSLFDFEGSSIDGINFISRIITDEDLFEEIYIAPSLDQDIIIKGADRFGLDMGTTAISFDPFDVKPGERLFVYCTALEGASFKIRSSNGDSERFFTGPFLTELNESAGEVKLEFLIDSEGEEVCYISLFKLNENALNGIKEYSGKASASKFTIDKVPEGTNTLILPYLFDDSKIKINGKYCEAFEFYGRHACSFENNSAGTVDVTIEHKDTGIVPGVLISVIAALCFVAIPITQMYNKKKTVSGEGNNTNVK